MELKNNCERDYIKEAFDKLYNRVMPYIDLEQFADANTAFKELDKKVHSEIYILKKCLAESDRAVDAGLTRSEADRKRISELEQRLNNECKHGEDLADINGQLASENADLKERTSRLILLENSRTAWRSRAQHAEKAVEDLNKKISELEKELAQARNSTELHLRQENERLRGVIDGLEKENTDLQARLEECDISTREQASYKSLVEAIEFQGKRIEELEAEKARLKEAYDIHETTIKKENVDLSPGHEFKFGDEVFVPWSDGPYMYVKYGMMYNPRTKRLVYVGKDQHLKWFGERFEIK